MTYTTVEWKIYCFQYLATGYQLLVLVSSYFLRESALLMMRQMGDPVSHCCSHNSEGNQVSPEEFQLPKVCDDSREFNTNAKEGFRNLLSALAQSCESFRIDGQKAVCLSHTTLASAMSNSNLHQVASGNAHFTCRFYNVVSGQGQAENILFAPLSAYSVLAMTYQGAAGETAQQFEGALGVDKKTAANGCRDINLSLNALKSVFLKAANRIFVMRASALKASFEKTLIEYFSSEMEPVDFQASEEAADNINSWVEEKTNSKIKNMVGPDSLDAGTRLVLVNAVYFRGEWQEPFYKHDTVNEPFYVTGTDKVDCQMMHQTEEFRYALNERLDAQVLELPYVNDNVSMVLILPSDVDGLSELERKIESVDLPVITKDLKNTEVKLSLPKFKFEASIDLQPVLKKIGLEIIFDKERVDLSEMSGEPLHVSEVVQKTFIDVNEEGTEAAAATYVQAMLCYLQIPSRRATFTANHPFIFFIQSKCEESNAILFYGKVTRPSYN